jgi:hypothetical protein
MTWQSAQGQISILCKECGGATTPREDFSLSCPYCGSEDRLPENELDRAIELRRRVAAAAGSVAQLDGLSAALASIFEDRRAFLRVAAPWLVVALLITVYQITGAWGAISAAPGNLRLSLLLYAVMGTLFTSGIALSMMLALWVGRVHFRRAVRPLLIGRPPREPGKPARCRACGGDLPDERGPLLRCRYCRTHSLVTPELERDRAQLLEREETTYRQRAIKVSHKQGQASMGMTRIMLVAIVACYLSMFGVAKLATALLPHHV